MAVITPGIAALGEEVVARIVKTIEVYDDFCHASIRDSKQSTFSIVDVLVRLGTPGNLGRSATRVEKI